MPDRLEDYAVIGDMQTAALVSRHGSLDWLCLPRFDSGACFAALLGTPAHGRWLLSPSSLTLEARHGYRPDTLILEREQATAEGRIRVVEWMPIGPDGPTVIRIVQGLSGSVSMTMELRACFNYGAIAPAMTEIREGWQISAGAHVLRFQASVPVKREHEALVGRFTVTAGEQAIMSLSWQEADQRAPSPADAEQALAATEQWWRDWIGSCRYQGRHRDAVCRSLITLKALTNLKTGGILAAATTSLPEQLGGMRNWDYRYCWLRDSTFTLSALLHGGLTDEARAWRAWLLRAVAGDPTRLQILYRLDTGHDAPEYEADWLPGYHGARPVRIGNGAARQLQLDVYGEIMNMLDLAHQHGIPIEPDVWDLQCRLLGHLGNVWHEPDHGIWEVRGPRRHFTHSKVMAWVAFDRGIKAVERYGMKGPVEEWRRTRGHIRQDIETRGCTPGGGFVQYYGAETVDASLLRLPLVGFIDPTDPRVHRTVAAIERTLLQEGFVQRYVNTEELDALPPGEGAFLACGFWLAENYALMGRRKDAWELFKRIAGVQSEVGLLSEEFDVHARRLVGNLPQALSHVALVNAACRLEACETHAGG